jgi:hypothetical protein
MVAHADCLVLPVRCCFDHTSRRRHRSFFLWLNLGNYYSTKKLMCFEARLVVYCIVHLSTSFWRSSVTTARNKKNMVHHSPTQWTVLSSILVLLSRCLYTRPLIFRSEISERWISSSQLWSCYRSDPIQRVDIVATRSSLLNHMPWLAHTIGSSSQRLIHIWALYISNEFCFESRRQVIKWSIFAIQ